MNIFKRRERTEQATANPPAELRKQLEEAQAYAESREKMRVRWESLYRRLLERYGKVTQERDEARREVVEKTAANTELAGENKDLKQGIDAAREETRQAKADRARAEQELAAEKVRNQ